MQDDDCRVNVQISVFHTATLVSGVHGAGLTNIVFMRPGAAVLELMPQAKVPSQPGSTRALACEAQMSFACGGLFALVQPLGPSTCTPAIRCGPFRYCSGRASRAFSGRPV